MEDICARASLSYLTNRCDEAFQLIYSYITTNNDDISLDWEEQKVFCLVSIDVIERRYKSWIRLNRLLVQTEHLEKRQAIQIYIQTILNELNSFSEKIILLIEKYLLNSSVSPELRLSYVKIEGDIHFFVGQTSKSERKIEHMLSSLSFYNQALEICHHHQFHSYNPILLSITYNKALLFIVLTEEYNIARDLLSETWKKATNDLFNLDRNQNESENELKRIEVLLKYLEQM